MIELIAISIWAAIAGYTFARWERGREELREQRAPCKGTTINVDWQLIRKALDAEGWTIVPKGVDWKPEVKR